MIAGVGAINPNFIISSPGSADATGGSSATGTNDLSFSSLVSENAGRMVETLRNAEQLSVEALQGKGDMRQVVDAVMTAEQALQTSIAIRDKIVTAFLEVSRMAI